VGRLRFRERRGFGDREGLGLGADGKGQVERDHLTDFDVDIGAREAVEAGGVHLDRGIHRGRAIRPDKCLLHC
jgi:hypothetical protein